ncbi:MAG: hypothetical protein WCP31_09275 [Chloroflexales bacterium]
MDLTTIALLFVAGLSLLGLVLWMLNRAWGDFPSRLGPQTGLPLTPSEAKPTSLAQGEPSEAAELPPGASADDFVLVAHPLVRRAVEQALARGGSPYATFFIRDGERIYLVLSRIADPTQRELARRVFAGVNDGNLSGIGLNEIIQLLGQLGK